MWLCLKVNLKAQTVYNNLQLLQSTVISQLPYWSLKLLDILFKLIVFFVTLFLRMWLIEISDKIGLYFLPMHSTTIITIAYFFPITDNNFKQLVCWNWFLLVRKQSSLLWFVKNRTILSIGCFFFTSGF